MVECQLIHSMDPQLILNKHPVILNQHTIDMSVDIRSTFWLPVSQEVTNF